MTDVLRNSLLSINGSVGGVSEKENNETKKKHTSRRYLLRLLFDLQILSAAIVCLTDEDAFHFDCCYFGFRPETSTVTTMSSSCSKSGEKCLIFKYPSPHRSVFNGGESRHVVSGFVSFQFTRLSVTNGQRFAVIYALICLETEQAITDCYP